MSLDRISFETDRLTVADWGDQAKRYEWPLRRGMVVSSLLTPAVTTTLPSAWQGEFDESRGEAWFSQRESEGPVLVAVESNTSSVVGFVLLFEVPTPASGVVDLRLGYLLGEDSWGRGLATELVEGFVNWCQRHGTVRQIHAGVGADNVGSVRVLEKNGFRKSDHQSHGQDLVFSLTLTN